MPYHTNSTNNGIRTNLYTAGSEYVCETNNFLGCGRGPYNSYVGPIHYHPSKGFMAGAEHSEQIHPILKPLTVNGATSYRTGGSLSSGNTSTDNNHKHSYNVDTTGNGQTSMTNGHSHNIINNQVMQSCDGVDCHLHKLNGISNISNYKRGGRTRPKVAKRKLSEGGMLVGPSHEDGGISAIVDGTTPIEVEGGEFVINKQTVDAVGEDFLHKLNSTQTSHHVGGFNSGELPSPSQFATGGGVNRMKMRMGEKRSSVKNANTKKRFRGGGMMKSPECRMHNGKIGCDNQKGCHLNPSTLMCHG